MLVPVFDGAVYYREPPDGRTVAQDVEPWTGTLTFVDFLPGRARELPDVWARFSAPELQLLVPMRLAVLQDLVGRMVFGQLNGVWAIEEYVRNEEIYYTVVPHTGP